jgi:hypothetical protein
MRIDTGNFGDVPFDHAASYGALTRKLKRWAAD